MEEFEIRYTVRGSNDDKDYDELRNIAKQVCNFLSIWGSSFWYLIGGVGWGTVRKEKKNLKKINTYG